MCRLNCLSAFVRNFPFKTVERARTLCAARTNSPNRTWESMIPRLLLIITMLLCSCTPFNWSYRFTYTQHHGTLIYIYSYVDAGVVYVCPTTFWTPANNICPITVRRSYNIPTECHSMVLIYGYRKYLSMMRVTTAIAWHASASSLFAHSICRAATSLLTYLSEHVWWWWIYIRQMMRNIAIYEPNYMRGVAE